MSRSLVSKEYIHYEKIITDNAHLACDYNGKLYR